MTDLSTYLSVRPQMRPADVIAFSGATLLSDAIELFSGSILSHIAIVRQAMRSSIPSGDLADRENAAVDGSDVMITESTIGNGHSGPQTNALGEVLERYPGGRAWWLPLSDSARSQIDWLRFYAAIGSAEQGVRYDVPGLFGFLVRDVPVLGARVMQAEPAGAMFCSGLVVDVFERAGLLRGINYRKTSPQDVAEMKLYREAVQLLGAPAEIARFNTL